MFQQLSSLKTVSVEQVNSMDTPILCVFGCLLSERGKAIKAEMLDWLTAKYGVVAVNQDYPGTLFEFPALLFAQLTSIASGKPVLYVHTKGAFNATNVYNQEKCRKVWKREFIDNYDWYLNMMQTVKKCVACPFIGTRPGTHTTWLNGFMATPDAWSAIPRIQSLSDRAPYEHLFRNADINARGHIMSNVESYDPGNPNNSVVKMAAYINALK